MYLRVLAALLCLVVPVFAQAEPPRDTGYLVSDEPAIVHKYAMPEAMLIVHGGGHFTIEMPSGVKAETYGDPIMKVDGIEIGHWPGSIVTYRLPDGTELTCRANGPQGDTTSIEVWAKGVLVVAYSDVNTPQPKRTDDRPLFREKGSVLEWRDDTWCPAGE